MNATRVPGVRSPRPTPSAPNSSTTATAKLGITSRKVQNFDGEPHLVHGGVVERAGGLVVAAGDERAAAEALDHPEADRALLGRGREVALLVLDPPGDQDVPALEAVGQRDDRQGGRRDDEAERPVHLEQHQGDHDQLQHVHHQEQQPEAEEPPDARQVVGDPGEQLAGLPLAVEGHRQLLEPRVEVVAHGRLDAEHRVGLHPAADEDQHRLEDAQRQREQAERQQRAEVLAPRSGRRSSPG